MEEKKVKAGSVAIGICLFVIAILLVLIVLFFYNSNKEKNNLQDKISQLEIDIEEKNKRIDKLNKEFNEQEIKLSENLLDNDPNNEEIIVENQKKEEVHSNKEVNESKNNFEQTNNQVQEDNNNEEINNDKQDDNKEQVNLPEDNFEQPKYEEEIKNEDASQIQEDIIESNKDFIKGCIKEAFSLTHAEAFANYYMSDQSVSREEYIADFYTLENIKNNFDYKGNLEVVGTNIFKVTDDNKVYFAKVTLSENMSVQNVEIFTEEEYNQ